MTREEVIAYIRHQYNYPAAMPDDIWRTEYGALQEWEPPYPSVREEGSPCTKHVWKITATGERLANYFIPTNRDEKPEPDIVLGFLIDDAERRGLDGRTWRLSRPEEDVPDTRMLEEPVTQEEYIHRYASDRFVVWRRHEQFVFDGSGEDFLVGTAEEDLKLPISNPVKVGPNLHVLLLLADGDIWFYYHYSGEQASS